MKGRSLAPPLEYISCTGLRMFMESALSIDCPHLKRCSRRFECLTKPETVYLLGRKISGRNIFFCVGYNLNNWSVNGHDFEDVDAAGRTMKVLSVRFTKIEYQIIVSGCEKRAREKFREDSTYG